MESKINLRDHSVRHIVFKYYTNYTVHMFDVYEFWLSRPVHSHPDLECVNRTTSPFMPKF